MKQFPKDFLWGASTSAYQVEGGAHTQWTEWEQTRADWLTTEIPRRFPNMPHQEHLKGVWDNRDNYIAGRGVEHYERYEADFDIVRDLHMNAFRFGIEWARLEPKEGVWDQAAIEHYRQYIVALKQRGIEPILTLWHWTMPTWFTNKGAFEKKQNLHYFDRYVQKVIEEFGDQLKYVLTLNEPNVYTVFGYVTGDWPPEKKASPRMFSVYRNLVKAHNQAYKTIKRLQPTIQVGLPANLGDVHPKNSKNPLNHITVGLLSWLWNWWFLNMVRNQQDFIGVNYYFTEYRDWLGRIKNPPEPVSDLGWYMEPNRLGALLNTTWQRYHKPLMITENGLADSTDSQRQWWIKETLAVLEQTIDSGVPIIGYLHWSLLDNFEWAFGWWPQFGLVHVDRRTMKRTVRPSARWFAEQIKRLS